MGLKEPVGLATGALVGSETGGGPPPGPTEGASESSVTGLGDGAVAEVGGTGAPVGTPPLAATGASLATGGSLTTGGSATGVPVKGESLIFKSVYGLELKD